ncbi:MAG: type II toxin-antitoxin system VapC family toxin [Gemmatimonadetes bacterium]|nr:type II toxin-antitoxin system VapC family toxin [Gemmatimonadota bacterium]
MIVVDTNVIAYLVLEGEHTGLARLAFRRDPAWAAPTLWRSEFCNVLAGYVRRRDLDLMQALEALRLAESTVHGCEFQPSSEAVLQLAAQSRCSAYDCEFIASAHQLGLPLVTSDRQILDDFPETAIALSAFSASG